MHENCFKIIIPNLKPLNGKIYLHVICVAWTLYYEVLPQII